MPALPSFISTLPVGLNLMTCWPLPFLPSASAAHTLPSGSMVMPCGNTNMPAPKLASSLPVGSKCRIGGRLESAQLSPPQRSNTQTLLPSRSTATAVVPPQVRPAGSWPKDVAAPYGSGKLMLGGALLCACAGTDGAATPATAAATKSIACVIYRIDVPFSWRPFTRSCVARDTDDVRVGSHIQNATPPSSRCISKPDSCIESTTACLLRPESWKSFAQ